MCTFMVEKGSIVVIKSDARRLLIKYIYRTGRGDFGIYQCESKIRHLISLLQNYC